MRKRGFLPVLGLIMLLLAATFSFCSAQEQKQENNNSSEYRELSPVEKALVDPMTYIVIVPNLSMLKTSPAKLIIWGSYFYFMITPQSPVSHQIPEQPVETYKIHTTEPEGMKLICSSNEKNIGTALEMYAVDNDGHYPKNLKKLTPDYLVKIPECQAAGKDTYSTSYKVSYKPDAYTFYCSGSNHSSAGLKPNFPLYNSWSGFIEK
ncbi:MAG: hypothetical protein LWY06_18210 [Firmicutes bacterium]|nr:hypothetical protein [Bacillota bacterium]